MLTDAALRERLWDPFPMLRRALEGKRLPNDRPPYLSTDDTLIEELSRYMELAELVQAYEGDVARVARELGTDAMHTDIRQLVTGLECFSHRLRDAARQLEQVCSRIDAGR